MDPLKMYVLLNMGMFHCYVSLPEGNTDINYRTFGLEVAIAPPDQKVKKNTFFSSIVAFWRFFAQKSPVLFVQNLSMTILEDQLHLAVMYLGTSPGPKCQDCLYVAIIDISFPKT